MEPLVVILIVFGVPVLIAGAYLIATYNRLVRLRQHLRESWSGIDLELKRRHDLIPNLVETVKGYASHERETLERVVELRNRAAGHQTGDASDARELSGDEDALAKELARLFVVIEAYPDLKADASFMQLQRELAVTEDRIAASRRFFNGNVRDMNTLIEQFPSSFVAGLGGFTRADYFELDDHAIRNAPGVSLS